VQASSATTSAGMGAGELCPHQHEHARRRALRPLSRECTGASSPLALERSIRPRPARVVRRAAVAWRRPPTVRWVVADEEVQDDVRELPHHGSYSTMCRNRFSMGWNPGRKLARARSLRCMLT
jgi:hypothetical protein